jgi:hypothetical protein
MRSPMDKAPKKPPDTKTQPPSQDTWENSVPFLSAGDRMILEPPRMVAFVVLSLMQTSC